MFRSLATWLIHLVISPRIEQLPDERRRRYFRSMAWFCFVLAWSEVLFASLILSAWLTFVWETPVLPAIWLAIGAVVFLFVAAVTFMVARIARERAQAI